LISFGNSLRACINTSPPEHKSHTCIFLERGHDKRVPVMWYPYGCRYLRRHRHCLSLRLTASHRRRQ
jgi:hypothetical protein